jgi:hypothetical protein
MCIEHNATGDGDYQARNGPIPDGQPDVPAHATAPTAKIPLSHPDYDTRQRVKGKPTWDREAVKKAVLDDLEGVLDHLGIPLTGVVTARGWLECHAFDRDEASPSAGIDSATGVYHDFGSDRKPLSIFDLAVETGRYPNYSEAVNGLGERQGVPPKVGRSPGTGAAARLLREGAAARPGPDGKKGISGGASAKEKRTFPDAKAVAHHLKGILERSGFRCLHYSAYAYGENFQVVRIDLIDRGGQPGKEIRPIHRVGPDRWVYGDPPGLLPLFNLEKLTDESPVLIAEGEKCVIAITNLGFGNATTSAHGSECARKSDWSRLPGRRFAIIPDADRNGEKYAADVVRILKGNDPDAEIRIVRLPGLAEGEDVADWVARGGDADGLSILIAAAPAIGADVVATDTRDRRSGGSS